MDWPGSEGSHGHCGKGASENKKLGLINPCSICTSAAGHGRAHGCRAGRVIGLVPNGARYGAIQSST